MRIRFLFALWAAKASRLAMKLLGRNATYLPGKLALKICPDFLGHLTPPKTVIAVTGTNGKTTTSNLLASILRSNGYAVTNNSLGSNVQAGVTTVLLADSNLMGKAKNEIAVLEVDERSSMLIYPYIKPDYLYCNNIMRDSIMRNAHIDFISYILNKELPASTKLVLNADDLLCASLGPDNQDRTYFGVAADKPAETVDSFYCDIVYCPSCGGRLENEYLRYNHIGRMHCPACGGGSPAPDFCVTGVDRENMTLTVSHDGIEETYPLLNGNIVNIYNQCGAIALLTRFGLTAEQIAKGFSSSNIVKTRFDHLQSGDLDITMQMAKGLNPVACTQGFRYAATSDGSEKGLLILIDDKRLNIGDTENICWQYDCDYSYLTDDSINQIVFAGPRCKDHYLRALLAGVPAERMKQTPVINDGAEVIDLSVSKNIFVLYDSYSIDEADHTRDRLVQRGKEGSGK